ncbi:MAG: type II secretion system major pseudopilin GspG [Phycisphaerales bacterium]
MKTRTERQRRALRRGFTFIEVVVVVIIIGILATLIAPRIIGRIMETKQGVAKANAKSLRGQVNLFIADCRSVRSGDSLRELLLEGPGDAPEGCWKGPYVNKADELLDPWGNEFMIVVPGERNFDYDIVSYGSDGKPGGEGEDEDIRE